MPDLAEKVAQDTREGDDDGGLEDEEDEGAIVGRSECWKGSAKWERGEREIVCERECQRKALGFGEGEGGLDSIGGFGQPCLLQVMTGESQFSPSG